MSTCMVTGAAFENGLARKSVYTLKGWREAVVNTRLNVEAMRHEAAGVVTRFRSPRYEVPAPSHVATGPETVISAVSALLSAFPDFYLRRKAIHHAEDAVTVEAVIGGTHLAAWGEVAPTGRRVEVQAVLIFVFDGDDLLCEKMYFDQATILRQLGALA